MVIRGLVKGGEVIDWINVNNVNVCAFSVHENTVTYRPQFAFPHPLTQPWGVIKLNVKTLFPTKTSVRVVW